MANDPPLSSSESPLDREFGSWLLVPRRRGHARGCAGGTRAAHEPVNAASETRVTVAGNLEASTATCGPCGGFRGRGRSGNVSSRDACTKSSGADVTPPCDHSPSETPSIGNLNISPITPVAPRDDSQPNCSPLPKISLSLENNSNPNTVLQTPPNHSKSHTTPLQHSNSLPLILRLPQGIETPSLHTDGTASHMMLVDKVFVALDFSQHAEGASDFSGDVEHSMIDDEDADMSKEEEEEIDNHMTMDRFQDEQRRGALVRKSL